ncbi:conserved Plasmodium protein, unknown function [Plasmodium knowlesi strain H]|uniref:Uncharacterized protein n=3 Tax=Plasmodium knowlesi TaxID=5850 RepID=A0A5K1VGR6_PLAKH|nr:conserved Plasmodium protein, unknown function [Plasmodium knowlesi strain H]OTN66075.1 Uncharacterized protein PKNOH_S100041000 [Plasmodium knowlesi]CAA9987773.1 conserved Plasmodium protein, unknown function [Plasmodium knowlesi strain H]SBO27100.1 conserved Plasmodium protein, unknown function [Plasmodium knowlesi strain H]SBO29424.1 conserved Plasmodium protein, unknown function [Plasmodium knowlesi strain H]VVS77247.1 conserved Plasmodium protein, unknown function [Plasmodium knowlesi |eukprot:XP_002258770.1 hypothetical protein, conserved in Plasmodium species [Plasmodium knowlesi strain H]
MNDTDGISNEDKKICHHNLRKNRKPRSYDFEYVDESLNRQKGKRRGRKRGRKPKNALNVINKSVDTTNIDERVKRPYIRKRSKESNVHEQENVEKVKSEDYIVQKNEQVEDNKLLSVPEVRPKEKKRKKKFIMDKSMQLLNSNIPLRNSNIKVDRICEYLSYQTKTTWRYMGSTVKFRLVNDQQEKYIFLKNMKKHIIFEIIKIAMFAMLRVNLNDNNIYTLHTEVKKRPRKEHPNERYNTSRGKRSSVDRTAEDNYMGIGLQSGVTEHHDNTPRSSNSHIHCSYYYYGKHRSGSGGSGKGLRRNSSHGSERGQIHQRETDNHESYYKQRSGSITHGSEKNFRNSIPRESEMAPTCTYGHYDFMEYIHKRLQEKDDILNQGVTVSEILDFVKEKYEKYYENVKQYIVTTLNIYCALNIFKLIRRGRYTICRFEHFNIFKVKYFKKYFKFFYTLKGEEEILMNVKNYLKSFYYNKTARQLRAMSYWNAVRASSSVRGHWGSSKGGTNEGTHGGAKEKCKMSPQATLPSTPQSKEKENIQSEVCAQDETIKEEQSEMNEDSQEKSKSIKHENVSGDITTPIDIVETTTLDRRNSKVSSSSITGKLEPDGDKKDAAINAPLKGEKKIGKNKSGGKNKQEEPKTRTKQRKRRCKTNGTLATAQDEEKMKNVFIDLNKINIKCINVAYGIKHFFCSYDTKETNDEEFEIIKVQKKYDILRGSSIANMNLRYNSFSGSKRLQSRNVVNCNNDNYGSMGTKNLLLRTDNSMNINVNLNKDDAICKQPQYGKQKKQNYEDDVMKHEKYNTVNFNISYKTLRKKMICIRHYVSSAKKEERSYKARNELKGKDKLPTISNDSLIQTCSINSNMSVVSVEGISPMNLESHCSQ